MARRIAAGLSFRALAATGVAQRGACGDRFLVGMPGARYAIKTPTTLSSLPSQIEKVPVIEPLTWRQAV